MSGFPRSPRLLKGGLVLIDAVTSTVQRIIALQYNPDSITRTLQVQGVGPESGDRAEVLRLKGPPIETLKVDAELDATDQLEIADSVATDVGLQPQLAALEIIVYPTSVQLQTLNSQAQSGTLEVAAVESPLTVFVWSRQRILPVRLTEFSITEEAFDPNLNPIRAKVSLGMRVLNVNDTGFAHKAGGLFMTYLQNKEQLARRSRGVTFSALGITGV
jgi:Contractile injection system tube protein